MKYYLKPKTGYTWEDLELEGVNIENAEIVKIVNGEVTAKYPYIPSIAQRLKPEFEKGIFFQTVMYMDGREIPLERVVYEDMWRSGCNPFKQAIIRAVSSGSTTPKDVIVYILDNLKIMKKNNRNISYLSKLIGWMTKEDYLIYVGGILKIGIRRLSLGNVRIPIKRGYNPILFEMLEMAKDRGTVSKDMFASYLITSLSWIERDPITHESASTILEKYLRYLTRNGYLEEVEHGRYKYIKPLEPNI